MTRKKYFYSIEKEFSSQLIRFEFLFYLILKSFSVFRGIFFLQQRLHIIFVAGKQNLNNISYLRENKNNLFPLSKKKKAVRYTFSTKSLFSDIIVTV